ITSHGMLAIGGIISLGLGSFLLTSNAMPGLRINPALIIGVVGSFGIFVLFLVSALVRTRRTPAIAGIPALIGMRGIARTAIDPYGTVLVNGELWRAHSAGEAAHEGERVEVIGRDGM